PPKKTVSAAPLVAVKVLPVDSPPLEVAKPGLSALPENPPAESYALYGPVENPEVPLMAPEDIPAHSSSGSHGTSTSTSSHIPRSPPSHSHGGPVNVRSYTRKDGTHVGSYTRSAPSHRR